MTDSLAVLHTVFEDYTVNHYNFLVQLEDGKPAFAESQEDVGAPAVAAHVRSLTEPRSEEERQVKFCLCAEAWAHLQAI